MNTMIINDSVNASTLNSFGATVYKPLTFNEVLDKFSSEFVFKMELLAIAFFAVMCLYFWYVTKLYQKANNREDFLDHIQYDLGIEPIIESRPLWENEEKIVRISTNILFIPSVVIALIFLGHATGWFI